MPTSTFRVDRQDRVSLALDAKWLIVPPIDEALRHRGKRALSALAERIPRRTLMLMRILRISTPPRKLEIELHRFRAEGNELLVETQELNDGEQHDWQEICPDLMVIALDMVSRWPPAARPTSLAIVTDGKSIAFNPGRPSAKGYDWIVSHMDGQSPCARILGDETNNLFGKRWLGIR